eukprot:CAMPEP_0174361562 /NCGR_PEP_ID=MMETSP0811_2-20130205/59757_1 /TAXON_ID=73025 ORGANISM="Eutreptiella gymnastica-like, Strain CCMP1594" /NCGR_SAMPLE_ID=MMETSP0811_2 /ASSEMBLY_ACC=CAM_ASM_000667 /LENGTH=147 /DNA_ID=CAMNT_0015498305 /DNA_START=190 /DNA_END=630 /DNA_ORIENTATION=-
MTAIRWLAGATSRGKGRKWAVKAETPSGVWAPLAAPSLTIVSKQNEVRGGLEKDIVRDMTRPPLCQCNRHTNMSSRILDHHNTFGQTGNGRIGSLSRRPCQPKDGASGAYCGAEILWKREDNFLKQIEQGASATLSHDRAIEQETYP